MCIVSSWASRSLENFLRKTLDLSFMQIIKKIGALALPMAGGQVLNVASGFLCMGMLAALGHQVLAASALGCRRKTSARS